MLAKISLRILEIPISNLSSYQTLQVKFHTDECSYKLVNVHVDLNNRCEKPVLHIRNGLMSYPLLPATSPTLHVLEQDVMRHLWCDGGVQV
jgi:hypothetical protein